MVLTYFVGSNDLRPTEKTSRSQPVSHPSSREAESVSLSRRQWSAADARAGNPEAASHAW